MDLRGALLPRRVEVEHEEIRARAVPDNVSWGRLRYAALARVQSRGLSLGRVLSRPEHRIDRAAQGTRRADDERERSTHDLAQLLDRVLVRGIRHRHRELAARAEEGHGLDPVQDLLRKTAHLLRIDRFGPHIYIRNAELLRERPADVLFGRESKLHKGFADQASGLALPREALLDLGFVDDSALDENRGERPRRALGPGHRYLMMGWLECFRR